MPLPKILPHPASSKAMGQADQGPLPHTQTVAYVRATPLRFEHAYEALYEEVAGYVSRRTGDCHVTEDLVSDIFLSALDGLRKVRRPEVPFRFWLFRIATNRVNRWWTRNRRRERLIALVGREREEALHFDPDMQAGEQLGAQLRRLSAAHQTVLSLHYLQELSIGEIAEILECAPGTVKSRLARAREAFVHLPGPDLG